MPHARFTFAGAGEMVLHRWQNQITDATPAFEAMAEYQAGIWRKQFSQEGAYTGSRWSPLSPPYARWKQAHYPGKPILERSGELKSSMTRRPFGVDRITPTSMTIGTNVPYAQYHQIGTPQMPARPLIGPPPREDLRHFAKILQSWIVRGHVNV